MATLDQEFRDANALDELSLVVGGIEIAVRVASTPAQRAIGMTGQSFEGFDGLLFVQDSMESHAFHNRGVPEDLLVALFDDNGELVEQFRLEANDATIVQPTQAYRYALEMPASVADLDDDATIVLQNP